MPPAPPVTVAGLSYTLVRGNFMATGFPSHSTKVVERGKLTSLGAGYSCNPLLPLAKPQACASSKYRTLFSFNATGILRVAAADIRRNSQVQLMLKATGHVRVTIRGSVVADLSVAGATSLVTKTTKVTLPAGDAPIRIEWTQASGTSRLQLLWKTDAALVWAAPRLVVA
jgi:hypothetical protein